MPGGGLGKVQHSPVKTTFAKAPPPVIHEQQEESLAGLMAQNNMGGSPVKNVVVMDDMHNQ